MKTVTFGVTRRDQQRDSLLASAASSKRTARHPRQRAGLKFSVSLSYENYIMVVPLIGSLDMHNHQYDQFGGQYRA